jgi:hypothetical protein
MNISFDGVRERLAGQFNDLARSAYDNEQREVLVRMRETIAMMLYMYDPTIEDDYSDLSGDVSLEELPKVEEEEDDQKQE